MIEGLRCREFRVCFEGVEFHTLGYRVSTSDLGFRF